MPDALPALSVVAMPGRRRATIELCREAERRGFTGIFSPSPMGNMSMCEALAWQTGKIPFATSIAPIYQRTMIDGSGPKSFSARNFSMKARVSASGLPGVTPMRT